MDHEDSLPTVPEALITPLVCRARDNLRSDPVLGDTVAAETLRRLRRNVCTSRSLTHTRTVFTVSRTRRLDQWCSEFLLANPRATVLHLGCGLDARAHRLTPPPEARWYDVDLPGVIDMRRRLLPQRTGARPLAADVTDGAWLDAVAPTEEPVLVVAEGVLSRLRGIDVTTLLCRITRRWDRGELVFDAVAAWAAPALRAAADLRRTGAPGVPPLGRWGVGDPRELTGHVPRLRLAAHDTRRTRTPGFERLPSAVRALSATADHLFPAGPAHRTLRYRW